MLTSALTFPIVFLQALPTVCPFLYLTIGMSLPRLMSRQVSLAGLPISTCCTHDRQGKLSCSLGYIVLPSKKSQWPADLSSPILTLSRFSPLLSSSPFDFVTSWTRFGCFHSQPLIMPVLLIQMPLQPFQINPKLSLPSRTNTELYVPQYARLTSVTSLLFYCFSNLYNLYNNIICTCLGTLQFSSLSSQSKFPEVKV